LAQSPGRSLCPAPIAYAATTSEGATRTIPDVWTNY
jgi:hypothetical protein